MAELAVLSDHSVNIARQILMMYDRLNDNTVLPNKVVEIGN